jgi:hypothetical protein
MILCLSSCRYPLCELPTGFRDLDSAWGMRSPSSVLSRLA